MHTLCIRLDVRATPSGLGPVMAITCRQNATVRTLGLHRPEATLIWKCMERYGKPIAQKTIRMLNASIWSHPREIRDKLVLGLLSL